MNDPEPHRSRLRGLAAQGMVPKLIAIVEASPAEGFAAAHAAELELCQRFEALAHSVRPGTLLIQLRCLEWSARQRLLLGQALRAITRRHGQWLAVNDRLDLAALLEADALHLGERSVDLAAARAFLGEHCWISRAWHDLCAEPPLDLDAVLLSPICAARKGREAVGLDGLARFTTRLRERSTLPVYALGGVTHENAAACLAAGASGVAVLAAAWQQPLARLSAALAIG